ncbi:hypothetical protein E2C01_010306 [Portunus trituberculatus]|uniref:Uncharacterized protein n=1 Tax=Portunus trituberculatus TaxID=210409 RepID=A0A5B7D835_PORTR|nr:hypothetical protein [Portunus trituberculatus]
MHNSTNSACDKENSTPGQARMSHPKYSSHAQLCQKNVSSYLNHNHNHHENKCNGALHTKSYISHMMQHDLSDSQWQ